MRYPLIVIEGLDGSGKATQTKRLCRELLQRRIPYRQLSFPDYAQDSSALVKMYLNGDFGLDPQKVNAYAAASFYAVDRYASFVKFWKNDYDNGVCMVADRYVTSNFIYQMTKLPCDQWDAFMDWVQDYEYRKLGLPRPDVVLYLDVPPAVSQALLSRRYDGNDDRKDIHERNIAFLQRCREAALYSARKLGWRVLACAEDDRMKPVEQVFDEMLLLLNL